MIPHYVGLLDDDGQPVAAALLLERKPPFFPAYLYSPRGFVLDFSDDMLLNTFTDGVREFARSRRAMFVALDPDIELWEIDERALPISGGFDHHDLIRRMAALGYHHRGFNREFEGRQPRFTFRIDLSREQSDIDRGIVGNVLKNVRKSQRYATEVTLGDSGDIGELSRLVHLTGERDEFVGYDEPYYQNFYDILSSHGMALLFLGRVDPVETVEKLRLEKLLVQNRRETLKKPGPIEESLLSEQRLNREIDIFQQYAKEFGGPAVISAHLLVVYGDKAWAVHAGSDKRMSESFINNSVYYRKICEAKQRGALQFDQFGTTGNPDTSRLHTLHAFKRQFGGRYMEFVGEFDLILRPLWFFVYEKLLPLYRNVRISLHLRRQRKPSAAGTSPSH